MVDAYLTLRKRGNAPLFRGRLFLLGQDRPSNNRLKATLMGENVASDDFSSSTLVNCNHFCKINAKAKWKSNFEIQTENSQESCSMVNLEDDYEIAIARNVAIEILKSRQNTKKMAKNKQNKNGKKIRGATLQQFENKNKSNKVAPTSDNTTLAAKLPPNMVTLVESCLKELEMDKANNKGGKDNAIIVDLSAEQDLPGDIGLSVWQLNGHPDLMSTFYHFLSHEAIYVLTFDLLQDLNDLAPKTEWDIVNQTWIETDSEMTNLEYLLTWINYIYHQSRIKNEEANNIIIVGTNRSQLHPDSRAQEGQANLKFEVIREALRGQAMEKNVCQTFFALDELEIDDQDHDCEGSCCQFCQLKLKVYHLSLRLPRMGMRIPESWVQFEKVLHLWLSKGIQFAAVDEMFESYKGGSLESFQSLLDLYEDLGMIYLVDKQDNDNHGLVIFDTQSFFTLIAQLSSPFHFAKLVQETCFVLKCFLISFFSENNHFGKQKFGIEWLVECFNFKKVMLKFRLGCKYHQLCHEFIRTFM